MKHLDEALNEYERRKQEVREEGLQVVRSRERRKKELQENRVAFLEQDSERGAGKEEIGKQILEHLAFLTSQDEFMAGLRLTKDRKSVRKVFDAHVKYETEYLDVLRERLGHFKRSVTEVFAFDRDNELIYYQYWTPTQWAEGLSCFHSGENRSDPILLRNSTDFKLLSYNAVSRFHQALENDEIIGGLVRRIKKETNAIEGVF